MATKEDALWFKHESTSGKSLKIRKLQRIYGHWGKGIYWDICEFLLEQDNFQFVCDESSLQVVSEMIGCNDEVKFLSWYNDCINLGLLETDGKVFYSPALLKRLGRLMTSRENGGKGGRPKKTETKPNNNLNETKEEPNNNQSKTYDNHTKSNTNSNKEKIYKKDFSNEIIELGKYVFKDTFSVERAITSYSTSLNNLKESFLNFLMSEKYHEKELNELAMDKMSKHFFRWLLTHQPKKVENKYADLLQGEWGVDFHLKPTPNDKEAIQELLNDGWVRTNEGMAKRIKK